ncbi:ferrous iron transport protein B [Temperatibacter marinus]|uniref:Ferrous iron transport protein B n=1 Tax=Temperatibacter marinus TaxID=1456591 RepID=A0AA52H995_9PROT|nr:ferrous iron transport protein B [Temperatibacter marinus]WND01460.1 ferrous iron transport protein B [Temperatibacter marinus]
MKTIAIIGNPNCGKSALFNALTGLKQKVANYPGATVERRTGPLPGHDDISLIDLPGTYSLSPRSQDEAVTRSVLLGEQSGEAKPDALILTVDATNLQQNLRFAFEVKQLGIPMVMALNMADLAARDQIEIDLKKLSELVGLPVIETVAVRKKGLQALCDAAFGALQVDHNTPNNTRLSTKELQQKATITAKQSLINQGIQHTLTRNLDALLLHKGAGLFILLSILFFMFQAVFSWAALPMDLIEEAIATLQTIAEESLADGWVKSILIDALLAGVGAVIVFLPQIIILFLFILILESTGYMARAAFLMDKLMATVGLNGRAFIPLLSSFACAIPGIMAARTISNERDRLATIMIAPLMACSARLPVYQLLIGAFIPASSIGPFNFQGIVMFALYLLGILSALIVAYVMKRVMTENRMKTFMMELPKYQMPNLRFIMTGLYERAKLFLHRAGTIIFYSTIILWVLSLYPLAPEGASGPAIHYSFIGILGSWLEVIFAPIGFNWEMSIALIPGMAAREVAVAALGTVYSLSGSEDMIATQLRDVLAQKWSLATALSFLVWFVYAPQCISTIAVVRRETNGWKWPLIMMGYMFGLAYVMSFLTYHGTLFFVS